MARAIDAEKTKACIQNVVEHLLEAGNPEMAGSLQFATEIVDAQPTIEPKQEWISVKDRLPEVEERVLVYSYEDGINFGYFLGYEDGFFIDCVYPNEPTHWMPLPEPPETE